MSKTMNSSNDDVDSYSHGFYRDKRLSPVVFYSSVIGIVLFSLWAIFYTDSANTFISTVLNWISNSFGWFYFLVIIGYLVFVIAIAFSRYGKTKLGPDHSTPDFNTFTWASMLFAAGIGTDIVFFSVVEPVSHFLYPPMGDAQTVEAAQKAMQYTFLHWGLSGWGIYSLVGMSLAFFSYRHGMPLTFRSALYPLFGKRIYGVAGDAVDIAAVIGTVFGIATSLGIGVIQLGFGMEYIFGIKEGIPSQVGLIIAIITFAAISAVTGVEKGIRRLSEFNVLTALILAAFVLITGKTRFILDSLVNNLGDYFTHFISLSTETFPFEPPQDWLNGWTLFFWAWWIAWGPFVGLFLARISRGRTIKAFILGTLIIPLTFAIVWMGVVGNSAIDLVMGGAVEFGEKAVQAPGSAIYLFLEFFPLSTITTFVVTILGIVFFVTSGDSGSLVLSNMTYRMHDPNQDAPAWIRVLWAAVIGIITLALLVTGGLDALQNIVVVMGLPFAFVLVLVMLSFYKAIRIESLKEESVTAQLGRLSGRGLATEAKGNWAQRLKRMVQYPRRKEVEKYVRQTVAPAFEKVKAILQEQGYTVVINDEKVMDYWDEKYQPETKERQLLAFDVDLGEEGLFVYQVWTKRAPMPMFGPRVSSKRPYYYRLQVRLRDGGRDYDMMNYSQEQVIEDLIDSFEHHLTYLRMRRELGIEEADHALTDGLVGEDK